MEFRYIKNAEVLVGISSDKQECSICLEDKKCYDGEGFFGDFEMESICPECLASGALVGKDAYSCNGDSEELERQLKKANPPLTDQEIKGMVDAKDIDLMQKTPVLITWQEWNWPCADGDYCQLIGYGSKPLYESLSKDQDPKAFFTNSFYGDLVYSDTEYLWDEVLSPKQIKSYSDSEDYGTLFYVFKSQTTDTIVTIWDCD